jgi:hypothetical protein
MLLMILVRNEDDDVGGTEKRNLPTIILYI